jgi:glycosyltransferase involved in cell wall biosynthesis
MTRAYLEVATLFEEHWTGISTVTGELAVRALRDPEIDWQFVHDNVEIERSVVGELLKARNGAPYLAYVERRALEGYRVPSSAARAHDCVFPNVKTFGGKFRREAIIVHDLSTLLTPQFHHQHTIDHHAKSLGRDLATSDHIFCVSDATRRDVIAYMGAAPEAMSVLPLGVRMDPCALTEAIRDHEHSRYEPYLCVLGTIEPRKNGRIVLELIADYPEILDRYRIVFIGRDGWLDEKGRLLGELERLSLDTSRVTFTGFVSEETKLRLLLGSRFCIYPSYFEGYGIPVAEAALLGKYVVCSNSSSLTEVAPDMSFFFDPTDLVSFNWAFRQAETASEITRLDQTSFVDVNARLEARNWSRAYAAVRQWVRESA